MLIKKVGRKMNTRDWACRFSRAWYVGKERLTYDIAFGIFKLVKTVPEGACISREYIKGFFWERRLRMGPSKFGRMLKYCYLKYKLKDWLCQKLVGKTLEQLKYDEAELANLTDREKKIKDAIDRFIG